MASTSSAGSHGLIRMRSKPDRRASSSFAGSEWPVEAIRGMCRVSARSRSALATWQPAEPRQLEVHHHQVGHVLAGRAQRLGAVFGAQHVETGGAEVEIPDVQGVRVVVDDQNGGGSGHCDTRQSGTLPRATHALPRRASLPSMTDAERVLAVLIHDVPDAAGRRARLPASGARRQAADAGRSRPGAGQHPGRPRPHLAPVPGRRRLPRGFAGPGRRPGAGGRAGSPRRRRSSPSAASRCPSRSRRPERSPSGPAWTARPRPSPPCSPSAPARRRAPSVTMESDPRYAAVRLPARR